MLYLENQPPMKFGVSSASRDKLLKRGRYEEYHSDFDAFSLEEFKPVTLGMFLVYGGPVSSWDEVPFFLHQHGLRQPSLREFLSWGAAHPKFRSLHQAPIFGAPVEWRSGPPHYYDNYYVPQVRSFDKRLRSIQCIETSLKGDLAHNNFFAAVCELKSLPGALSLVGNKLTGLLSFYSGSGGALSLEKK